MVIEREVRSPLARVKRRLRRFGLLPYTDRHSPSLVSIVAGAPVSGSWWGHPAGKLIYRVGERLDDDPSVLVVKLWGGKRTLVDRRLWPALVRVANAREAWQVSGLSEHASRVLARIDAERSVRSDPHAAGSPPGVPGSRDPLRSLEARLLVRTRSVHTQTGAHALEAESWTAWSTRTRTPRFPGSVSDAQRAIEEAAQRLRPDADPRRFLPWGRTRAIPQARPRAHRSAPRRSGPRNS